MRRGIYLILLCILLPAVSVFAADQAAIATDFDVLVPESGHLLFGVFQGTKDDGVAFVLDSGSSVSLPWDKINELQLNHKALLRVVKGAEANITTVELDRASIDVDGHNLVIVSESGSMTIAWEDLASISNSSATATSDSTSWKGVIAPTAGLVAGTQRQQTFGGSLLIKRTAHPAHADWRQQSTALQLDANNALVTQPGSAPIRSHEYDGKLNHELTLTQHLYANVFGSGYHNNSFELYLEQTYGGGFGGTVRGGQHSLELTANLLFVGEHFSEGAKSLGFAAADLSEIYTIVLAHLKGGNLTLGETGAYIPAISQQKAWQARGNANLSIPIFKNFSWNVQYRDDYMENAPNRRKNWSTTSASLTYSFSSPNK